MRPSRRAQGRHPRLGPEPHRPGHRVRLLLRARQLRPARRRLRDGDGQLQPRDRLDRLRHQRPPLLRAAHPRGRAERASRPSSGGGWAPLQVIVSLGGQTPLKLAGLLPAELVAGTSPESIDRAEDRDRWNALCAAARDPPAARRHGDDARPRRSPSPSGSASRCSCGPSYVLGGRAMQIVYDDDDLIGRHGGAGRPSASLGREGGLSAERPVLIDRFLEDATEVDVDAIRDATGEVLIGGVMEHVEEAGRALGRLGLRHPAAHAAAAASSRCIERHTARHRRRPRRPGPHQRAVRREAGPGVRDRGQPAGAAARCRSWPRPPACRWPRWRPG